MEKTNYPEPRFVERQYMSQILIAGAWCFLDYHKMVRQARKRTNPLGDRGRIVRITQEIVKENEVR